ncbi:MAG: AAA family ATPase, partial [Elusimicrobia bacterium]|nr:AAA family ATPase [Elusimicrobiota bacterium]
MLESIGIRNFALLEKASLKFSSGFNVITGETGAGKSILIGALNMVLGERVGREIVRPGEKFCEVEAVFAPPFPERVIKFLKDMELDETELFLRRIFEAEGRSRCFINDRSVTLSSLKGLGDMLVDIHSQSQHQELLNPSRQLNLLDLYGGSAGLRKEAVSAHGKLVDLHKKREELILREEETSREAERLRHEIREIDALELSDTFEEELEADYKRLLNSGRLAEGAAKLYAGMYESDGALFEQLSEFGRISLELSEIDSGFTPVNSAIQKALFDIETAANLLRERVSPEDNPQARLEEVSGQKDQLISLKLKFGPEVEDILKYRQEIGRRI